MVIVLDLCGAERARDVVTSPSCGNDQDLRFQKEAFSYIHLARIATCWSLMPGQLTKAD
jgi:hypothetical protein